MISEAMVCLVQTVDLSCTDFNIISKRTETGFYMTQTNQNELPFEPRHLGIPSGASKMIWGYCTFGAIRAPIMHRNKHYLQKIETRFYMTHVT
jgi:hypothetical protein